MRILTGAVLLVACAIFASGYEIATAVNKFVGRPLLFLAWAAGLAGAGLIIYGWLEENRPEKKP